MRRGSLQRPWEYALIATVSAYGDPSFPRLLLFILHSMRPSLKSCTQGMLTSTRTPLLTEPRHGRCHLCSTWEHADASNLAGVRVGYPPTSADGRHSYRLCGE